MSLGPSVRDVGRAVLTGGRRLASMASEYTASSDERDESASTGAEPDPGAAADAPETPEETERAGDPARRIGAVVSAVDPKYTAKVAVDGTKRGLRAGPYGAVAGAGAGVLYGVYASNREDFDPEEFSDPVSNHLPVEELKSEYATAASGYRYGKRFGLYGGAVGTALGAGVDVMVRDGDEDGGGPDEDGDTR